MSTMTITANGDDVSMPIGSNVTDLLEHLGLGQRVLVVERNGEPVSRADRATTLLVDGDRLELVRAVAGG